ncbi:MAG TPA: serpin family protein, partial [Patescibacteria group bacterium]|nr:serpin family protein [Patescibacteria group bacterium]
MKKILAFLVPLVLAGSAHAQEAGSDAANANRFTLAMAQAVIAHQTDPSDNVVVSPYNALSALSLAGAGAGGATRDEFAKALYGTDGAKLDEDLKSFSALNKTVLDANKGHVDLLAANGIWVNKNIASIKPDYAAAAKENFSAAISVEDFGDSKTLDKINNWAGDNTRGLIDKVLQELDPNGALILASALYFKGEWTYKFDKAKTKPKNFTPDDGKSFQTPMMHEDFDQEFQVVGQDRTGYEAVALTYGAIDSRSMRLVLVRPKDAATSARNWLSKQAGENLPDWLDRSKFDEVRGAVELPHLDIKQHYDLIPALKAIGINAAFTGDADFSAMAAVKGPKIAVTQVSHDVVFKTDEEGSEAAAVTTIAMAGSAMMKEPRHIDIKFDRSFVFALQDA